MKQQINIRPGQAILISITWKNFRRNRNKNNETWTEETGNLITGNFSANVVLRLLNFNENLLFRHFENAYRVFQRHSFIKFLGGIRIMDIVGILCNDVWGNIDVYSDWICKYIWRKFSTGAPRKSNYDWKIRGKLRLPQLEMHWIAQ